MTPFDFGVSRSKCKYRVTLNVEMVSAHFVEIPKMLVKGQERGAYNVCVVRHFLLVMSCSHLLLHRLIYDESSQISFLLQCKKP